MVNDDINTDILEKLPEINIGVVGHIDHGKTTLLYKLTGKFPDTHSEELKRGITIKLGYTDMIISKSKNGYNNKGDGDPIRYISFIDAPGHEMLMATMLSGAAIVDAAILVIAANEGIKPQTREHFVALQAKKIKSIIIAQNKIDLVTKEQALKNYKEIKEFLKGTDYENSPIIPISAQQEINLDKLMEEICSIQIIQKNENVDPIFLIARSFDINHPGSELEKIHGGILGGVLKQGKLKIGDEIEIKPGITIKKGNQQNYQTIYTKIISIHKGKLNVQGVKPGASISLETELDPYLTKADFLSGCLCGLKDRLPEISYKIKMDYELFKEVLGIQEHKEVSPIKLKEMLMLSVQTTITVGIVEKIKGKVIELSLNVPIVSLEGENVGIARNIDNHWRLIGWGNLLKI